MVLADLGTKITAAIQQMASSTIIDDSAIEGMLESIADALYQGDVDVDLVKKMRQSIKDDIKNDMAGGVNKRKLVESAVIKALYSLLDSGVEPYKFKKGKSNVVMFVGLQGAGKTTTCTKFAYYYKKRGWKTCLVCADTFRAGAFDQLKQNATKAKIPFYGSYTERDPVVVAEEGVKRFREAKYEIIIVDTSGRHKQEAALFEEMQEVARACQPDTTVFVMDSSIGQAAKLQAEAFNKSTEIGAVIITKLDGHAKGGGALSAVAATKSPIIFVGTGEHMDEFEAFNTKSFVSRLLGKGDITGLLSMFEEKKFEESQKELMKKLKKGDGFTFRDMKEQFTNLLSMGPIGKLMSMIPGLGTAGMGPEQEQMSKSKIKRYLYIMDSMNQQELDGDDSEFLSESGGSRIYRIAKGSGSPVVAVHELLATFLPFKKLFANMSDMGPLTKSGNFQMSQLVGRQGRQNMAKMAQGLDPNIIRRVGGMGGLQTMMRQFAMAEKKGTLPKGF